MLYIMAGKLDTVKEYLKRVGYYNNYESFKSLGETTFYVKTKKIFDRIGENDTLVLLPGWWGRSWAKDAISSMEKEASHPEIIYADGRFGEEARKSLKSDTIHDRFEILDL